jgi:hypothetical protein
MFAHPLKLNGTNAVSSKKTRPPTIKRHVFTFRSFACPGTAGRWYPGKEESGIMFDMSEFTSLSELAVKFLQLSSLPLLLTGLLLSGRLRSTPFFLTAPGTTFK